MSSFNASEPASVLLTLFGFKAGFFLPFKFPLMVIYPWKSNWCLLITSNICCSWEPCWYPWAVQHLPSALRRGKKKSFVFFLLPMCNWFPQNNEEILGVRDLLQLENVRWLVRGGLMGQRRRGSSPVAAEVITHFWWEINVTDSSLFFPEKCSIWGLE